MNQHRHYYSSPSPLPSQYSASYPLSPQQRQDFPKTEIAANDFFLQQTGICTCKKSRCVILYGQVSKF
jgi:hypothetical protein